MCSKCINLNRGVGTGGAGHSQVRIRALHSLRKVLIAPAQSTPLSHPRGPGGRPRSAVLGRHAPPPH